MAIAAAFPWDRYKTVIDIGCAEGVRARPGRARARAHERRRLRPAGGRAALRRVRRSARARATGCASTPATSSPTTLPQRRRAGHGPHPPRLGPGREAALLEKAYAALPDGGALIVYEAIIDDDRRENAFGLLMSLNMLIETPGGFDYTGADCQRLDGARPASARPTSQHLVGPGLDGGRDQVGLTVFAALVSNLTRPLSVGRTSPNALRNVDERKEL